MALKVYNTLTRKKEVFKPLHAGKVSFYLCGPTVYDYFHIGNARPFIIFDIFRRFLVDQEFEVTYVVNITDVDDKIIERSAEENRTPEDVTSEFIQAYQEDLKRLRVQLPDVQPRATQHVAEMITLVEELIKRGIAYSVNGDVFYSVEKFPQYGQLSGKNIDELRAGSRVDVDERKENPIDFALWKSAKPGEPYWDSPWGRGRPGWHLECSVMSVKYLGQDFDFHAGGEDLIFPHHENELAQSQGAGKGGFARYWLHNGFLNIRGEKMSKSAGNFLNIRQILERHRPEVIRLFFLQKHYRSPVDYSDDLLEKTNGALDRLQNLYDELVRLTQADDSLQTGDSGAKQSPQTQNFKSYAQGIEQEMIAAMEDDFNTARAMGKMFELVKESNRLIATGESTNEVMLGLVEARRVLERMDSIFSLLNRESAEFQGEETLAEVLDILIDVRNRLRSHKMWEVTDMIRDRLKESGFVIVDGPEGSNWKRVKK